MPHACVHCQTHSGVFLSIPANAATTSIAATPAAELVQVPPTGRVASNLITRAVGTAGVSVLLARSFLADKETSPFGVTGQEQQDTICSSGVKA